MDGKWNRVERDPGGVTPIAKVELQDAVDGGDDVVDGEAKLLEEQAGRRGFAKAVPIAG